MGQGQSIVINGDLGSGKSAVSVELARRLGLRRISVGDVYRRMAQERGMTALQLNLHAALDEQVDGYVDQLQRDIARSGEQLVVDSRLAWFFFTGAFKVHLVTDPVVAAGRALARPANEAEAYASLDEAIERLKQRSDSERSRFIDRYKVDKNRLRNYDMICDTTRASVDEVVERIIAAFHRSYTDNSEPQPRPVLVLDPARIYPTQEIHGMGELWGDSAGFVEAVGGRGPAGLGLLQVGFADGCFFVIHGHHRLSAALHHRFDYVLARLMAEDEEPVIGGLSARAYLHTSVEVSTVYDWEAAHRVQLSLPPHVRAGVAS